MKALTLTQPWAQLVAEGHKRIETRSWRSHHRGPIVIHAAKGWKEADRAFVFEAAELLWGDEANAPDPTEFFERCDESRGCVIATAKLVDCAKIGSRWAADGTLVTLDGTFDLEDRKELAFGDYRIGRWAWLLDDIQAVPEPIPARGYQGLWTWRDTWQLEEALA